MKDVNFAFDLDIVDSIEKISNKGLYIHNFYDDKFYPLNGPSDICYFDYHVPLYYVCSKHNTKLNVNCKTYSEYLKEDSFFFYVLTFRYLLQCFTTDNEKNGNFFLKLPYGIIDAVKRNKCILIFNDTHEQGKYCYDFHENLEKQMLNVDIPLSNVVILTMNAVNKNSQTAKLKIIAWEYFETVLRSLTQKNNAKYGTLNLDDRFKNYSDLKHFIFFNRMPKEHRYYLAYHFYKKDLINNMRISFDKIHRSNVVSHLGNILMDKISKVESDLFFKELPYLIDTEIFTKNHWATIDYEHSYRNLISIVSETCYHTTDSVLLSEKTLKPISLKMPFIIAGQPHTLKRLQDLGYMTFSTLWDESYDSEEDVVKRMEMIIDLVQQLSSIPIRTLRDRIYEQKQILIHNYETLMSNNAELDFIDWISNV
jgi:hypothetical protein